MSALFTSSFSRIQMLQPENRIEELFTEGNTTEAIITRKIRLSEINFGSTVGELHKIFVEIPPVSLRAGYFRKLLLMIEQRTYGKFGREKEKLMQVAIGFKVHNADDAIQISKLIALLNRLERDAYEDSRLGANCAKYKPLVFKEVRWLLVLRALTYLHYSSGAMGSGEMSEILNILGLTGSYEQINDYRIQCLKNGCDMDISRLAGNLTSLNQFSQMGFKRARQMLIPLVYWASCFAVDQPQIRELFDSKEWNYDLKRYVVG